jgi:hypothetical protein
MDVRLGLVAGDRRITVIDRSRVEAPHTLSDFALGQPVAHALVSPDRRATELNGDDQRPQERQLLISAES